MAFAPLFSSQYTDKNNGVLVHGSEWGGKLFAVYGKLTFTSAGNGTELAKLSVLPPGRKLILPDLSRIVCPAGTATADLHIGHGTFTKPDGTVVAAADNAFMDNGDIGAGALDVAFPLPLASTFVMDSVGQVDIVAKIDTANSPAAGDLEVLVVFAKLD